MKTATLERYAVFGTSHHMQRLTYRGREVLQSEAPCAGIETLEYLCKVAKHRGFDRVRFAGDWKRYTVRKTLTLKA